MSQRSGVVCPLIVLVACAALACKQSPEEKRAAAAEEARLKAKLTDYIGKLAAVTKAVEAVDKASFKDKPCDGAALEAAAPAGKKGALSLRSAYLPWMKRFGAPKTEWKANAGDWKFITDSTFAGHFEKHPDDRDSYAAKDTGKRIEETFEPERYLVVVAPDDESKNALPVWHDEGPFDSGDFQGWMFVVDTTDASIACQKRLEIESSEEIEYRTGGRKLGRLTNQNPKTVLQDDFEDNLEDAIQKALKPVGLSTSMGRILK
ncbi:MAG: hypothetical protein R3B07_09480 [Polyangiaceae bacterium]